MWKRPEDAASPGSPQNAPGGSPPPPPTPPGSAPPAAPRSGVAARLGPTLTWEGKLAGEEDLLVEGRFKGEIQLPGHQVTIGSQGQVEGEVRANAIIVEGEVRGNLTAAQQVLVRASGKVLGDIRAPRVALDQGCRFKGAIDMEPNKQVEARSQERPAERREDRQAERQAERQQAERQQTERQQAARPNGERAAAERTADRATELPVEREPAATPAAAARAGR
jgi:cytoskeletal protein CcmA (bactofilin family)